MMVGIHQAGRYDMASCINHLGPVRRCQFGADLRNFAARHDHITLRQFTPRLIHCQNCMCVFDMDHRILNLVQMVQAAQALLREALHSLLPRPVRPHGRDHQTNRSQCPLPQ